MAVAIAELFVSVGADVSAAIAGLTAVGAATDSLAGKFKAAAPAALLLEGAAVGIGAGLFEATKVAASFEQAMADVRAVMTPAEVQQFGAALGDLAVTLGQQTVFSAREAAAGIGELIRAGIPAEDVLGGAARAALNLAAATGISVATAATVAAQTMNAFHKTAADLTNVVDTLAGTANATAANMSDLQFGLQVVSATAQTMGLSFEDTTAAIGVFVSAGQTGATAGTGLRQMLLELIPTTKPAKEEMKALGLSVNSAGDAFFDAQGHVKSLADISQVLQVALRGMSDEQKIAALNTLFTRDAINSAAILASQGADGINKLTDSIAQISAADTAAIRLGTLQGSLNNLGSSIETVQIIVGNLFLPKIRELSEAARGLVDRFSNLSPELQRGIVFFISGAGAVAGLIGAFVLLAPFIAALPAAFAALGAVLGAVAVPIAILTAIVFGLFQAWQTNFGGIRDVVLNTFDRIRPILENFRLVFTKAFSGDVSGALDTFRAIIGGLSPELGGFITSAIEKMQALGNIIATEVAPRLGELLTAAISAAITAGEQLRTFWDTQLGPAAENIGNFIAQNVGPAFDLLATAFSNIRSSGEAVLAFMTPLAEQFGAFAGEQGTALIKFFRDDLPPALAALGTQVASLGPLFGTLGEFFGSVTNLMSALATVGSTALRGLFENVLVPGFQQLAQALGPIQPTLDATGQAIQNMASGFTTIGAALEPVRTFFAGLTQTINALADALARPELAPILTPGSGARLPGVSGVTEGGGPNAAIQSGATTALALAAGGPLVAIGSLIISSEAEADAFIKRMAEAIRGSSGRVSAPPDNSAFPALNVAP